MATSLLRVGRLGALKHLQMDGWGVVRSSTAPLCTQTEEPAKITKAASKTAVSPDDRAALLAHKTAIAWPVRFSQSEVFPVQSVGAAEPVVIAQTNVATASVTVVSKTAEGPAASSHLDPNQDGFQVVADTPPLVTDATAPENLVHAAHETISQEKTPVTASPNTTSTKHGGPAVDGTSSSSSSDSDSDSDADSDSDSEDKSDVKIETKILAPEVSESHVKEKVVQNTSEVRKDNNEAMKEETRKPEIIEIFDTAAEDVIEAGTPEAGASESTEHSPPEALGEIVPPLTQPVEAEAAPVEVAIEPIEAEVVLVEVASESVKVVSEPVEAEVTPVEVVDEASAEVLGPVESTKELVDPASVKAESVGEKLQTEAQDEPSEEAAAAARPEPEEPFDNSTYKNCQHHSYNPYTFADLDLEMAKFRLPQPSSGRPSPRH